MDNIEARHEAYKAADEALRQLIDHPVKTVSVAEYRAMLEAAKTQRIKAYQAWKRAVAGILR